MEILQKKCTEKNSENDQSTGHFQSFFFFFFSSSNLKSEKKKSCKSTNKKILASVKQSFFACWDFLMIFCHLLFFCFVFSKLTFLKNYYRNTIRVSNSLVQIRPEDKMSGLIWVKADCQGYQLRYTGRHRANVNVCLI